MRRLATGFLVLAASLTGFVGVASAQDGFLGSAWAWEAHASRLPDGDRRCVLRALHDAMGDGDLMWVFDPAQADSVPDGFLVVDRRLADGATAAALSVTPGDTYRLVRADDLHFYSRIADADRLFTELKRGASAELTLRRGGAADDARTLPFSLIGFTAASTIARTACLP